MKDVFDANRSEDWRDKVDPDGVPTCGPARCDYGCHFCFGPLDAKVGNGQYECPWCIARFPTEDEPLVSDMPRVDEIATAAIQEIASLRHRQGANVRSMTGRAVIWYAIQAERDRVVTVVRPQPVNVHFYEKVEDGEIATKFVTWFEMAAVPSRGDFIFLPVSTNRMEVKRKFQIVEVLWQSATVVDMKCVGVE